MSIQKDIYSFIKISRPLNVLISIFALSLACFIALRREFIFVEDMRFWYSVICVALISATGYWINDVFDFKIDRINKPRRIIVNEDLSVKKVLTAYFVTIILVLGFSWFFQSLPLFLINLSSIFLLFAYAQWFKRQFVIGNLVIAALTALVIYYAAVLYELRLPLGWTMLFAFEITYIRELTKDVEDIRGDLRFKLQTLPIRLGIKGSKKVLFVAYGVFILSCYLPLLGEAWWELPFNWLYLLASVILVQLPCIYVCIRLYKANKPSDFGLQSNILKGIILGGMLSMTLLI